MLSAFYICLYVLIHNLYIFSHLIKGVLKKKPKEILGETGSKPFLKNKSSCNAILKNNISQKAKNISVNFCNIAFRKNPWL